MPAKSESSAVMNATGHSSAKSQSKPTTSMSTPHLLLKSSRGRVLWPDRRPNKHDTPLDQCLDDYAFSRTRQRTSSVTSIETIRPKVKPRLADAVLKPKLPLDEATITIRSARKRTHSATSPEADDADSGDLPTGPRVRQRRDFNFSARAAPVDADEQLRGILRAKMPTRASSALKKLKEKLGTPPAEESGTPRDLRPLPTKSLPRISKTENNTACPQRVAFPSQETVETAPAPCKTSLVSDASVPPKAQPLQTLTTNTIEPKRARVRVPIPGARLNKYGCYELSATEFELAVTFPLGSKSNFEVWDQEDDLFLVGPLLLHLTVKDPAKWEGLPISHPDVHVLEITCTSKAVVDPTYPYCASSAAENNKYSVRYEGARMRDSVGKEKALDPRLGIATDTLWFRTEIDGSPAQPSDSNSNANRRGWQTQFFVPLATRLFEKSETRAFQLEALVSVWGEELATKVATMSVSHLMWERELARR
ncbi:hypothetical protein MSAN_00426600 [Mycena sanguinolenta]|uniref:Uncharacterized protein n=1 Tax=Mycena sanguinolenta TaxID=230812 RepID=A0A8H6ZAB5_9AGAR|nr:hypothetical protein MSAN_00426600 [Mycena sanguinolenta]